MRLTEPSSPNRMLQCHIPPCDRWSSLHSPKSIQKGFQVLTFISRPDGTLNNVFCYKKPPLSEANKLFGASNYPNLNLVLPVFYEQEQLVIPAHEMIEKIDHYLKESINKPIAMILYPTFKTMFWKNHEHFIQEYYGVTLAHVIHVFCNKEEPSGQGQTTDPNHISDKKGEILLQVCPIYTGSKTWTQRKQTLGLLAPCQIPCQSMPGDMQLNCVLLWFYSILLKNIMSLVYYVVNYMYIHLINYIYIHLTVVQFSHAQAPLKLAQQRLINTWLASSMIHFSIVFPRQMGGWGLSLNRFLGEKVCKGMIICDRSGVCLTERVQACSRPVNYWDRKGCFRLH
ncbi:uncharacterized protein VP01_308g3 [Puccinia sorghi]|uniref:Uncharacterized protein n=1 Tax=Puccinia sorghi TaxID=27349 RepID=A0A0L6V0E4_9BASI|nr:uncharacterized protein VP01_308g3 [Puccinia sorghi]